MCRSTWLNPASQNMSSITVSSCFWAFLCVTSCGMGSHLLGYEGSDAQGVCGLKAWHVRRRQWCLSPGSFGFPWSPLVGLVQVMCHLWTSHVQWRDLLPCAWPGSCTHSWRRVGMWLFPLRLHGLWVRDGWFSQRKVGVLFPKKEGGAGQA